MLAAERVQRGALETGRDEAGASVDRQLEQPRAVLACKLERVVLESGATCKDQLLDQFLIILIDILEQKKEAS